MLMNASRVDRAVGEHKESTVLYICISMDWFEYTNHHTSTHKNPWEIAKTSGKEMQALAPNFE